MAAPESWSVPTPIQSVKAEEVISGVERTRITSSPEANFLPRAVIPAGIISSVTMGIWVADFADCGTAAQRFSPSAS
jgi:hypothetical protein